MNGTNHPRLVEGYAAGLLEIAAAEDSAETVADEMHRIGLQFDSSPQLRDALTDPAVPVERKQAVVTDILGGRVRPVTLSLINLLVGAGRTSDIAAVGDRMVALAAEREALTYAEVRSALPLDEATVNRLEARLSEVTGKRIRARVVVDDNMLGGVVAKVGDSVFDGSVRSRLQELREAWG